MNGPRAGVARGVSLIKVQIGLQFRFAPKLKYVWAITCEYFPEARELYELRYAALK